MILFKYPTRSRPEKFLRGYRSIVDNISTQNYFILVSTDIDDSTMLPLPEHDKNNIVFRVKSSKNKIDAINRDINEFDIDWNILVVMSDDMVFTKKGFDLVIREEFTHTFDKYLHFNDGHQKSNVNTMHIVGRSYYNRFNYVYHPDYESVWCDKENDDVAKLLGKYKYMGDDNQIFEHLHPAWGLSEMDEQYKRTENGLVHFKDKQTYERRKKENFYLFTK